MATPGEYLVNHTVEDVTQIKDSLALIHDLIDRVGQRFEALGVGALVGFPWPEGYTQADFEALCAVLAALPDSVVTTSSRNAIFKLIAAIQ